MRNLFQTVLQCVSVWSRLIGKATTAHIAFRGWYLLVTLKNCFLYVFSITANKALTYITYIKVILINVL